MAALKVSRHTQAKNYTKLLIQVIRINENFMFLMYLYTDIHIHTFRNLQKYSRYYR